jgi:hypothetical protein
MTSTKLMQLLESSPYAPYKLGALAALPVTAVLLLLWVYCPVFSWAWLVLCPLWFVYRKSPLVVMITMALGVGTYAAFMIWSVLIGGLELRI